MADVGHPMPLQVDLARLLEARGWRIANFGVRCCLDPLDAGGSPVGIIAAIHREVRREKDPGREFDLNARREGLIA